MAKIKDPLTLAETFEGHRLTKREATFIDAYMVSGDGAAACREAGWKNNISGKLLSKDYIANEVRHRLDEMKSRSIADATEVLEYFTKVMRGEVTDQFGLDAPLSERTNAAKELARRQIDMAQKSDSKDATINVVLDWKR